MTGIQYILSNTNPLLVLLYSRQMLYCMYFMNTIFVHAAVQCVVRSEFGTSTVFTHCSQTHCGALQDLIFEVFFINC